MSSTTATRLRRGFSGLGLIGILLVMAIILYLYFGSTAGNKSYMQTVVETKKSGEQLGFAIQAQQLAIFVADFANSHNGKAPTSYEEMGADPSSFRDTWGNPFRFSVDAPARGQSRILTMTSNGPDSTPNTEDDIVTTTALQF